LFTVRTVQYKGHDVSGNLWITAEERLAISGKRFGTVTYAFTLSLQAFK
jgi:hypothetical protein